MKVNIGPYIPHWSTREVEEWYLKKMHGKKYWEIDDEDFTKSAKIVIWILDKWQDLLNATFNKYFQWRGRKIDVHVDRYDVWSADHTLAYIIHPTLIKLRQKLHGSPLIDDEDVPEELRSTAAPVKENEYDIDANHFKRWEWALDEMIWSFSQILDDNADDQFHTGNFDVKWEKTEIDGKKVHEMVTGPDDTHKFDKEGYDNWNNRISNGLKLFGKYYRGLWD